MLFAGNFAPYNYAFCDGSLQSIANNDVLYNLLGTTYGGDGINTFGLPDLRGRAPMHMGTSNGQVYVEGQLAGTETVTLTSNQIPTHTHALLASVADGTQGSPATTYLAGGGGISRYTSAAPSTAMNAQSINVMGGSQPHDNMQPFVTISFVIALYGIYPSQN
jgi:microcystin-dependent protein